MKTLLFLLSAPPHGSILGQEALDALLMGSAFATCQVLFVNDGLFQLLLDQDTSALGLKNYSNGYKALPDFDVTELYCLKSDLTARGLELNDLTVAATALDQQAAQALLTNADVVLSF